MITNAALYHEHYITLELLHLATFVCSFPLLVVYSMHVLYVPRLGTFSREYYFLF
jgi:hypothetical protein